MNEKLKAIHAPPAISIADEVRNLRQKGIKVAALQTGEPMFDTPSYIIDALGSAIKNGGTKYSDSKGILELRKSISEYYNVEWSVAVIPENIFIGNGAVHCIYNIMTSVLNLNDEVILIDPSWPQYANIATLAGASIKRISTHETNGRLNIRALQSAISAQTKMVVINNPCNPSGVVYSEKEINSFVVAAKRYHSYLLFDEVYNKIAYIPFKSILQCKEYESYKNHVFYVNSFSKTFAMTGWRIGYAVLPDGVLKAALKISQNSITNVSTFSQRVAALAMRGKQNHAKEFTEMLSVYSERKNLISSLLSERRNEFMQPEGAFYFFIKTQFDGEVLARQLLSDFRIAVVPGKTYGIEFRRYFRISFAVDDFSFSTFVSWVKQNENFF